MKLTKNKLAKYFDHTFLKAYATNNDLRKLCEESKIYRSCYGGYQY